MAALVAGEKARMYAIGNVARGGATRGGYHSPKVFVAIGGVQYATARAAGLAQVDDGSLSITDVRGNTANTCQMTCRGFAPQVGQSLVVTLGSINNLTREFGGVILSLDAGYLGTPANQTYTIRGIDPSWLANQRLVNGRWLATSASVIAAALAPAGYTARNIQAGLPVLDVFSYTNQTVGQVLAQLMTRIGGTAFFDYLNDLHCFTTADPLMPTDPVPLTPTHPTLTAFLATFDLSQIVTRVWSEGGGVSALAAIGPGETMLPVTDIGWYLPGGGLVALPNQRVSYTGVLAAGGGSLVGPGAKPASLPTLAVAIGAGLGTGVYQYGFTWVTGSGETFIGPLGSVTVGLLAAPPTAPTIGAPTAGSPAVDQGSHNYATSFVTASGETPAGPVSTVVVGTLPVQPPSTAPTLTEGVGTDFWNTGDHVQIGVTFVTPAGETTVGPMGLVIIARVAGTNQVTVSNIPIGPAGTTARKLYRIQPGGGNIYVDTVGGNVTTSVVTHGGSIYSVSGQVGPTTNTAGTYTVGVVPLSAIPVGATGVTQRKIYRTAAGGTQLALVATIADNTTTVYSDNLPDASLGANALTVGTATANQVALSGIALGPAGVTSRKVYRTAVNGAQPKLLATIADNTTLTLADSVADGSLGANPPASDTSGLAQPAGQINPGATSALLAGAGPFSAGGGWASLGGQIVRYTGISGNALIGIPVVGVGAIGAPVTYNATALDLACLTGIPASGPGALSYALLVGDPVNILAQVDDPVAQATLSALLDPTNVYGGTRGIQEATLQDGTIGYTEARARGLAELALRKLVDVAIQYTCQDVNSHAGRTIAVALPLQGVPGSSFKIASVTQTGYTPALNPIYTVQAGARFSFEDLLRQAGG